MKNKIAGRHKTVLSAAIVLALGVSAMSQGASAATITFNWSGYFHMQGPTGAAVANTSVSPKANQYETPISGALIYDTASGVGTANISSFFFFGNPIPASFSSIQLQAIGDGNSGPGNLVLGNMLFNWNGSLQIPVSTVWDASGLFGALPSIYANGNGTVVSGVGVRSGTDGTYVGGARTHITSGYMNLGVVPLATTKFDTTPLCASGGGIYGTCMGVLPSGGVPLIVDTAGSHDYVPAFMGGTGQLDPGITGSPMLAGDFQRYSASFDIASLTVTSVVAPIPASAWLLGSGLSGLIGVARRKKASGKT